MSARLCFLQKAWLGKNLLARLLAKFNSCMTEAPDFADCQLQLLAMWASSTWLHQARKEESYEMQSNRRAWQPISFAILYILYWLEASHRSCLHSRAGDYTICNIIHIVPMVFYIYYRRWGSWGADDGLRVYLLHQPCINWWVLETGAVDVTMNNLGIFFIEPRVQHKVGA